MPIKLLYEYHVLWQLASLCVPLKLARCNATIDKEAFKRGQCGLRETTWLDIT